MASHSSAKAKLYERTENRFNPGGVSSLILWFSFITLKTTKLFSVFTLILDKILSTHVL